MLSPARPARDDPQYEDKMRGYRKARRHQRRHPEAWGWRTRTPGAMSGGPPPEPPTGREGA